MCPACLCKRHKGDRRSGNVCTSACVAPQYIDAMQCPFECGAAAPLASTGLRLAYQHGGVFQCSVHGPLPLRRVRALATKGSARSWQCAQGVHGACATSARPQQERPVCCQALMTALVRSDVHCTSVLLHLCARQQRRCRRQATQLLAVALSAAWRALRLLAHIRTAVGHGTGTCTWFSRLALSFELVLLATREPWRDVLAQTAQHVANPAVRGWI